MTEEVYTSLPDAYMALVVPNNEWCPKYCKGDMILLANRFPKHGEEALFRNEEYVYYRKFLEMDNGYILRCINNRHDDMFLKRMDSLDYVGTAIGVVKS